MNDQTLEYYHRRADEYDKIYYRDHLRRQQELAELYTLSAQVLSGRDILDLACGTGFWTRAVSGLTRSITAVDINAAMLKVASAKKYACPVNWVESNVFNLPFEEQRFDGILATFLVSHIKRQDLDRLGQIIRDKLRPGSSIFLADNNLICELQPDLVIGADKINTYKVRLLENGQKYLILKNYFEKKEVEKIFSSWGRLENLYYKEYYWAMVLKTD